AARARLVAEVEAGRGRDVFKPGRLGPGLPGRDRAGAPAAGEQTKKGPQRGEPGAEESQALHERLFRACPDYFFRGGPSIRNGFRSFMPTEISTLNGVEAAVAYFTGRMPALAPPAPGPPGPIFLNALTRSSSLRVASRGGRPMGLPLVMRTTNRPGFAFMPVPLPILISKVPSESVCPPKEPSARSVSGLNSRSAPDSGAPL